MAYADVQLADSSNLITFNVDYGVLRSNNNVALDLAAKTVTFTNSIPNEEVTFEVISVDSRYSLTLDTSKVNTKKILMGAIGQDLILNLKVPVGVNQGQSAVIARIHVKSASIDKTFDVNTNVLSELELNKIVVSLNGNEEKNVGSDGGSVKNVKPGDKVGLRFVIDNHYDSDYNYGDVEGTIRVTMDDSDFGDTVDEQTDFSINAGNKMDSSKDGTVEFTVPKDVKDGEYTLDIKVEGKDQNKAKFTTKWKMKIKIQRNKDDIRIESVTVTPLEVSCGPRNIQVTTKVSNQGSNNQKHLTLRVESLSLGLKNSEDFALDKGSSTSNTKTSVVDLEVDPNLKAGTYKIDANSFIDYTVPADKKTATVVVKSCATKKEEVKEAEKVVKEDANVTKQQSEGKVAVGSEKKNSTPANTVSTAAENTNGLKAGTIVETRERVPYTADDYLMGIIIVVVVFVISLIILCLVLLFK